ncbi:MAG: beta-N-acetylglucosaminidase domain-containing protein [Chloroflexi bacterium]|nr:beta-N-acetylglucosaminidase domain-containing protein [Chloroflexota bacterium]
MSHDVRNAASASGAGAAGCPLRGLKGLWWEPEQYIGWPAFLQGAGYDFLMLCYTFCPETGLTWRQPLRPAEREIVRELAADCAARGITLCLALHPLIAGQAWAPEGAAVRFHPTSGRSWFVGYWQARRPGESIQPSPPICYGSADDLAILVRACQEAKALGVGAIALCLDDVDPGSAPDGFSDLAAAHLWLANGLREQLPDGLKLYVVPTYYWTAGAREHTAYTAGLAAGLPADVDVFWTGTVVRDHDITAEKAREAASLFGRKTVVWLNYASNDSFRFAVQLPPDRPPAADLASETAGLLLNSTRQTGLARLDALVIGAYLADPAGYHHETAVRAALVALAGQRAASLLWDLLEAWRAVPDVRTLTADLQAGGKVFLDGVLGRLRPALVAIANLESTCDAQVADRQLWSEIAAGITRLRLLADALGVLESELSAAGATSLSPSAGPGSPARAALASRLAAASPEAACDADAVLTLAPSRAVGG